jgi:hypothetical protein
LGKLLDTVLCVGCGRRTFAVTSRGFAGHGWQVFAGS